MVPVRDFVKATVGGLTQHLNAYVRFTTVIWIFIKSVLCRAAIDCGDLPAPSNGQVNVDNGTLYLTGEATYECSSGYELIGTANRVCLSDGRWSGGEPSCRCKWLCRMFSFWITFLDNTISTVLRCGSLPDPPNGQVSTNNPPINGTLANYTCNNGFQLLGEPLRLCQRTQWSGSSPECVRKHSFIIPLDLHVIENYLICSCRLWQLNRPSEWDSFSSINHISVSSKLQMWCWFCSKWDCE